MTIDKNMLSILQFRDKILNVDELEAKNNIKLPPIYKAFITTFKPMFPSFLIDDGNEGPKCDFICPVYFTGSGKPTFTYDDPSICPNFFKEPEELLNVTKENMWLGWEGDVIWIADHSYYGGLMVGIKEHNADKIYHQDGGDPEFIANNIFEFIHGIYYVKDTEDYPNLKLSNLYRNWGEIWWKLRKN